MVLLAFIFVSSTDLQLCLRWSIVPWSSSREDRNVECMHVFVRALLSFVAYVCCICLNPFSIRSRCALAFMYLSYRINRGAMSMEVELLCQSAAMIVGAVQSCQPAVMPVEAVWSSLPAAMLVKTAY